MNRQELKTWSKEKIKGNIWSILPAIVVTSILCGLQFSNKVNVGGTYVTTTGFNWGGIVFYFVEVGLTSLMIKFITDQQYKFEDIFATSKDFVRYLVFGLIQYVFVFLWTLLFIIPGIIKGIAYSMSNLILLDDKYKDLSHTEVLKKSEEMMMGHKADYFWLGLSFIGWHILSIFTLFILEIWVVPYQKTATTKFLYDIKNEYEKKNGITTNEKTNENAKFCSNCGSKITEDTKFCPSCGKEVK